jgi:hypothetical protein
MAAATTPTSCPCRQHARLEGRGPEVRRDRRDLAADDVEGHRMDGADTERVLHGDGRDGGRPEYAERLERLQVRLDPRAAAAVAARDGQGDGSTPDAVVMVVT